MAKTVFEERQKFTQWWLILLFLLILGFMLKEVLSSLENGPMSEDSWIMIAFGILPILLIAFLFFYTTLYSRIDETGIKAVFKPFGFSRKSFPWSEIEKAEVIKYSPLKDYGGYGYRISLSGNGRAMNVSGKEGIQLRLKNKKIFLIGTRKAEEAQKAIATFMGSEKTS